MKVKVKKVLRATDGKFLKGTAPCNPLGRPVVGATSLDKLLQAVSRVETKLNKNLLDHFITRAFKSDQVLIAVMKKLIPDLAAVASLDLNQVMNDELAVAIQKKLAEKFGNKQ